MEKIREKLTGCFCCENSTDGNCEYETECIDYYSGDELSVSKFFKLKPELEAELTAAKEALEKQTAKKAEDCHTDCDNDIKWYTCPSCKTNFDDYLGNYCSYCGQKLTFKED